MIFLKNITHSFGANNVLQNINFIIADKDKLGLIGINGAGKSTLAKIIMGQISPEQGSVIIAKNSTRIGYMPQGIIDFQDSDFQSVIEFLLAGRPITKIENEISVLAEQLKCPQNENELKKLLNKYGNLQTALNSWGGYHAENELLDIIMGMNLENIDLDAQLSSLSGGERSKVSFARVLYSMPQLLILDEPTNHLDSKSRAWVVTFLKKYAGSVLVISHDGDFLDSFVNKIVRINEQTKLIEIYPTNYSGYLKLSGLKIKTEENLNKQTEMKEKSLRDYINRLQGVSGKRKRQGQSRQKQLTKLLNVKIKENRATKTLKFQLSPRIESSSFPLRLDNISFNYLAKPSVISELSLIVSKNEKIAVIGKNGAGKSTLLKIISGQFEPKGGSLVRGSKTIIGYYSQEQEEIDTKLTVLEEVSKISNLEEYKLRAILGRFLFSQDKVFQKISTLSPGEKCRLALAKLSIIGANLLLLDEPTNHLDPITRKIIAQTLKEYGGTIIVVTHEIDFLESLGVDRLLTLPSGEINYYEPKIIRKFLVPQKNKENKSEKKRQKK